MKRREIRELGNPAIVERLAAALRARATFGAVEPSLLNRLLALGALLELDRGEALIRESDAGAPEFYVLLDGSLLVQSQNGFIARLDKPGDVAGEMAVLMSSKRTADVIAEGPVRVVALPSSALADEEFAEVAAAIRGAMLRDDWIQY